MSENDDLDHKKSPVGNTSFGAKFYFFIGFIFSALLNIGGIANLIDSFVEWGEIISRVLDAYNMYIVDKVFSFFSATFNCGTMVCKPLSQYVSLSSTFTIMYYFSRRIVGLQVGASKIPLALSGNFSIIRMFFIVRHFFVERRPDVVQSATGLRWIRLMLFEFAIIILGTLSLLITVAIFFPFVVALETANAVKLYFTYDFGVKLEDGKEMEEHLVMVDRYNGIFLFWCCLLGILVSISILIKLNDVIITKCSNQEIDPAHWICTDP